MIKAGLNVIFNHRFLFDAFHLSPSHCLLLNLSDTMAYATDQGYPRPDFVRSNLQWTSLNGAWDFLFDDEDIGLSARWFHNGLPNHVEVQQGASESSPLAGTESESITAKVAANPQNLIKGNLTQRHHNATVQQKRKINVPYVFQTPASGIEEKGVHEVLWYERNVKDIRADDEKNKGYRLLLRFGAVDYDATVWVNGQWVGGHRGGHVPFDIDISDAVEAQDGHSHKVTVRVYDSAYDLTQPRGKQYWGAKPESIFYTPSGGIWQNVWLESVPPVRLADSSHGTILRTNDIDNGILKATVALLGRRARQEHTVEIEARFGGISVARSERRDLPREANYVSVNVDMRIEEEKRTTIPKEIVLGSFDNDRAWKSGLALWSTDYPQLYDVIIRLFDSAGTEIDQVKSSVGMRSLDWNTGDGRFKLNGYPLFQTLCLDQGYWPNTLLTPPSPDALRVDIEMAKCMGFNGCRKHQKVEDPIFLHWADRLGYLVWGEMANAYSFSDKYVDRFNQEWMEAVKRDINHPCIVTWTPVNESWGYTDLQNNVQQRNHIRSLYYMTKYAPILCSDRRVVIADICC